ncbi:hypothetical protein HER10_EVM0004939 [Colletotrichum scovillei]|uniref:uncharacterized protein n=1 Tax=Colletotrichum scovillei TaxID=1209932 RepID=UPI0015C4078B|nr:uncharacterized protein HER10_EVM0004939 [Colletotrichum scovillei]KAF4778440.1 hypothetical protein HER10_EVM0004939 [Colletotrichum scovillei]
MTLLGRKRRRPRHTSAKHSEDPTHSDTRPRPALSDERHSTPDTQVQVPASASRASASTTVSAASSPTSSGSTSVASFFSQYPLWFSLQKPAGYVITLGSQGARMRRGSEKKTYQANPRVAEAAIQCEDQFQKFDLADGLHSRPRIVT